MEGLRLESSALAAVLVAGATLAQAPAQPPAQPPQPTFRTEANYVRVDAYPTTGDGAPVTDLTQADFELLEGGAPQTIEQFERVVVRAAGPQDTRVEPNTVRESRAMAGSRRRGSSSCSSIPTTSTSAPRTRFDSRSSRRSIA